ncbi:hypothetical protein KIN20_037038 [Parelaphostrongylus tenuis]|uniref:Uncharacterized protein n=1 Tax=Parelaphostrongylus tenuis TaxID=148309 RepID=A0AAD5RDD3_PARTN|nr:hypothetical protein KIN20_037038 [Parelaphostrongylus tenuis]
MENCLILNQLAYNSLVAYVETWQSKANTLASTFEWIIQYRSALFWSTIIYNSNIMESFDSALEALPRAGMGLLISCYLEVYELDAGMLISGQRPFLEKIFCLALP